MTENRKHRCKKNNKSISRSITKHRFAFWTDNQKHLRIPEFQRDLGVKVSMSKLRSSLYAPILKKGRWCYSEKFTILLTIFAVHSWKWSWGAGASFVVGLKQNFLFSVPQSGTKGENFRGLWCFLCKFYSEKFPIFRAIFVIFFGNWLLDARATFRL